MNKDNIHGCWQWTASLLTGGYGGFRLNGKTLRAHRVSFELAYGPIPEGLMVRHKCDNRLCCNPEHLELGTNQDNMDDMKARGRQKSLKGSHNGNSKMRAEWVMAIRTDNRTCRELSSVYGIDPTQISNIKTGKQWSDIK
ncbi:hypothetical protein RN49_17570 [Pantoea agglomerans]|nr:hypothetical protein RN49_17570 [Pantoea agglomerans]